MQDEGLFWRCILFIGDVIVFERFGLLFCRRGSLLNEIVVGGEPMTVRHFVTELTGGTGVACLRLHSELARQGIDSNLHYRFGSSNASHVTIDPRHRWWLWRLWQGYVIARRWRQQNPERGIFIHSRWIYPSRLTRFRANA